MVAVCAKPRRFPLYSFEGDHRWRQNVVRTKCGKNKKVAHEAIAECVTDVIYYWIYYSRQHGIYLVYIITKQTTTDKASFYFKIFHHNSKAGLCPLWRARHCQTWLERLFSWNENLQRKQNWTAKSTNLKKSQVSFCHHSSPVSRKAWMLPWILQELKKYAWNTDGSRQHRRPFDSNFEWEEH